MQDSSAYRVQGRVRNQFVGVWALVQEVSCCGFGILKVDEESVPCPEGNVTSWTRRETCG